MFHYPIKSRRSVGSLPAELVAPKGLGFARVRPPYSTTSCSIDGAPSGWRAA